MSWKVEPAAEQLQKHHGIFCLTCEQSLPSKSHLRNHMNHDVRYLNERGEIEP